MSSVPPSELSSVLNGDFLKSTPLPKLLYSKSEVIALNNDQLSHKMVRQAPNAKGHNVLCRE